MMSLDMRSRIAKCLWVITVFASTLLPSRFYYHKVVMNSFKFIVPCATEKKTIFVDLLKEAENHFDVKYVNNSGTR